MSLFVCVTGDKNDERGMEMDEEIFKIVVIYSLIKPVYYILAAFLISSSYNWRGLPNMHPFLFRKPLKVQ